MLLKSIQEKHISGVGFGYVFLGTSFLYLHTADYALEEESLKTGCLFIIETGYETSTNDSEMYINAVVQNVIRLSTSYSQLTH